MIDLSNHFDLILVQMKEELMKTMYLLLMHPLPLMSQEMTTITTLLLVMMTIMMMMSMTVQVITMTRNPLEMTQFLKK